MRETNERIRLRVEAKVPSNGKKSGNFRRSDKCVGSRVAVISHGEIAVVRSNNGVGLSLKIKKINQRG